MKVTQCTQVLYNVHGHGPIASSLCINAATTRTHARTHTHTHTHTHTEALPPHPPNLYCIVSESTDNLVIIILQTVDTLAVFAVALDASQSVTGILPVALHVLRYKGSEEGGR